MIKYVFAIVFLCSAVNLSGQKVSGKVMDEQGGGIAYVNIGIKDRPGGVLSDSQGGFSFLLPDGIDVNSMISFSHLSYIPRHVKMSEIRHKIDSGQMIIITLSGQTFPIDEVNIAGKKMKEITFARKGFPAPGYAYPSIPGEEIGSVIEVDNSAKVSRVEFKILRNSYDRVRLRMNVYRIESDTLVNVLHRPVYCDIPKSASNQKISISPEESLILREGEYFVGLEFVDLVGEGQLRFPIFLHKSYTRQSSMAALKEMGANIGLSVKGYEIPE